MWGELQSKIRNSKFDESCIQKYPNPNKGRKLVYRLNYFCNFDKFRKANYVDILEPTTSSKEEYDRWGYNSTSVHFLYKSYNELAELEETAKRVINMANLVKVYTW